MSKIKICGLFRSEDIAYVNEILPDYAGFIINFPKSHRNLSVDEVAALTKQLHPAIRSVGVFVDEGDEVVINLLRRDVIDIAQLHGNESDAVIRHIQRETNKPVIKAFTIRSKGDIERANASAADWILLDYGKGEGKTFDWTLLDGVEREYFLAGGITIDNLPQVLTEIGPWAVDLSSGVETDRLKDFDKIREVVTVVRHLTARV